EEEEEESTRLGIHDSNNGDRTLNDNDLTTTLSRDDSIESSIEEMKHLLNELGCPKNTTWIDQLIGKYHISDLKYISLGEAIDEVYSHLPLSLSAIERDLLSWNLSNLEYGCGSNTCNVSLMHWDQDDEFALGGDHVMLCHGYRPLIESLIYDVSPYLCDPTKTLPPLTHDSRFFDPLDKEEECKAKDREKHTTRDESENKQDNTSRVEPKKLFEIRLNSPVTKVGYRKGTPLVVWCEDGSQ
ncbi:hypothetical protein RFI_24393, partial [Reticulomyxa filosa]